MIESHLPKEFWADSLLVATHIINKLPSKTLSWKSPFELLHKKSPSYHTLKTFGCLCYASNTTPHKTKFDARALRCIFIGYPQGQKGYKLFDIDHKTTLISRDVIFHEHFFPYLQKLSTSPCSPISISVHDLNFPSTSIHSSTPTSVTDNLDVVTPDSSLDSHIPSTDLPAEPISTPTFPAPVRKSTRISKPPAWLDDFHCNLSHTSVITSTDLSLSHKGFLAALSTIQEPRTYMQARGSIKWVQAMQQELAALETNETWEIVELPKGKKPIGCKWVYKIKLNPDGSVERYKARLVAKGYTQVEGIDYFDRFSPVAKAVTVRTFLAIASGLNWPVHQVDINNAFLHDFLDEDIYMTAPEGSSIPPGKVCKLKRSLYGLKQASRQWNLELTAKLISSGFTQSHHDHCLFIKDSINSLVALLVYVDDVLITSPSLDQITTVKQFLDSTFTIKDMGTAKYFLGLEIARSAEGMPITQHKFIRDIIQDSGLQSSKPAATPLPLGIKLTSFSPSPLSDPEPYRCLV
ncbi:UNVERIFIED_CONTAM: Retrovirus-related Pol polyprotein from transposon RE1 [Sesamum radiatum]|uniref:Retrovirus-related Pol polyprotein from transposon RE1 n=1 Tax=Sesamum radiatum TaxID=300843 RepID=A0AAW2RGC2_SESRA